MVKASRVCAARVFHGALASHGAALDDIDYGRVACPEAEAMLASGINCTVNESMDDAPIDGMASAVRKLARRCAR